MKCLACDRILNNQEATRKFLGTNHYLDLCNNCFSTVEDSVVVEEHFDSPVEDPLDDENKLREV